MLKPAAVSAAVFRFVLLLYCFYFLCCFLISTLVRLHVVDYFGWLACNVNIRHKPQARRIAASMQSALLRFSMLPERASVRVWIMDPRTVQAGAGCGSWPRTALWSWEGSEK
jgi:hypothetical protein